MSKIVLNLSQFIAEQGITLSEPLNPSAYLKKVLNRAEKASERNYSTLFTNAEDAMGWLESNSATNGFKCLRCVE